MLKLLYSILVAIFIGVQYATKNDYRESREERRHTMLCTYNNNAIKVLRISLFVLIVATLLASIIFGKGSSLPILGMSLAYPNIHRNLKMNYRHVVWDKSGIHSVTEQHNRICELNGFGCKTVIVVAWKELGFDRAPDKLVVDGITYIDTRASNGGAKSGVAILVEEKFLAKHPEVAVKDYFVCKDEESKANIEKVHDMKAEASMLMQKAIMSTSKSERVALKTESKSLYRKADALRKKCKIEILNKKIDAAKTNQLAALWFSPSKKIGRVVPMNKIIPVKSVCRRNRLRGKTAIDPVSFKAFVQKKVNFKLSDGTSYMDLCLAKELGIADHECVMQIRWSAFGLHETPDGKGKLTIVDFKKVFVDNYEVLQSKLLWPVSDKHVYGKLILDQSVAKANKLFGTLQDYCKDGIQIRRCGFHVNATGKITMARQTIQSTIYGATDRKLIDNICKDKIDQLKRYSEKEGFEAKAEGILPITKEIKEYSPLKESSATQFSVDKEAYYDLYSASTGSITVAGAELYVDCDHLYNLLSLVEKEREYKCLQKGQVLVSRKVAEKLGLTVGMRMVLWRYPQINMEPVIVMIAGFVDIDDVIQISPYDMIMLQLDCDFDGDHLMMSWDPSIVELAKQTRKFFRRCGGKTFAFEDMSATAQNKVVDISTYLLNVTKFSDVGQESMFSFMCCAMIDPTKECYESSTIRYLSNPKLDAMGQIYLDADGDQDYGPSFEIRMATLVNIGSKKKCAVTQATDAGKRGANGGFAKTKYGEVTAEIGKSFLAWSELFDHPSEVQAIFSEEGLYYKKNEGTQKRAVTGKMVDSNVAYMHSHIFKEVCGDESIMFVDNNGESKLGAYRATEKTNDNPNGFVYVADHSVSIPKEVFFIPTGVKEYDKMDGKLCVTGLDNDEFKKFVIGEFQQPTAEMTAEERWTCVSLEPNAYTGELSVALLRHRMVKAKARIDFKQNNDPRSNVKTRLRCQIDTHVENVIRKLYANKGIKVTTSQAHMILYNEMAKYLFGEHANEYTAADIAAFCDKHGKWRKHIDSAVNQYRSKQK